MGREKRGSFASNTSGRRNHRHSAEAVTRYINDFKRVQTCLASGEIERIPSATGLSKSLTKEYVDLINEERSAT